MGDHLSLILRLSSACLVFSGYMALASVLRYGAVFLFAPALLLPLSPLGAYAERRFFFYRMARRLAAVAYGCFIPFSLSILGLMDAVVALVIFIQAYLLLGEKNERVHYELYLMSFFLLLAAVVQSPEPLIAVALLLYGVSAIWALASLRMYVETQRNPARARPELRPLRGDGRAFKPGNAFDFGLVLTLSALSLLSVALTILFFMMTPRVEAGWLGRRDAGVSVTGLSETVRLTGGTNIAEDQSVVMHVRFPDEPEGAFLPAGALYWRVSTLSRFSGDEWSRRGLQQHYESGIQELFGRVTSASLHSGGVEESRNLRENARLVRQIVYMDEAPQQGVPCLDLPLGIRLLGDNAQARVAWDGAVDFSFNLKTRGSRRIQYEAFSDMLPRGLDELRRAPTTYSSMISRDYSVLTYHELLPETQARARELAAPYDAVIDKAMAINAWLSGPEFTYSLTVPPLPAQNGIDAFVNTIRSGHCELFASALALMCRSLGIPARVVSGYRGGEYIASDQSYLVRASMAHLWAEIYLENIGWVRMDPSPQMELNPTGFRRMQMAWSLYLLRGKMFWYQSVIGFEGGFRMDRFTWPWRRDRQFQRPDPAAPRSGAEGVEAPMRDYAAWLSRPEAPLLALAAAVVGALFLWRRRRAAGARAPRLTRNQVRARRLYQQFLRRAAALGADCDNKSAGEIQDALLALNAQTPEDISAVVACYNAVRFGGRPLSNEEQQRMKSAIRRLERSVPAR